MGEITPEPGVAPSMPQNTVVFNGAAFNLMTTLFEGVRADVRDLKADLTKSIDDRLNAHEQAHEGIRKEMIDRTCNYDNRIEALEQHDESVGDTQKLAKARRDGQLWAVTTSVSVLGRYGKWILMALIFIGGLVAGSLGDVRVTFGS